MALAETDIAPALPLDSIICGDALAVLRTLPDNSIDAIVTDPPYGLGTPPDMVDVLRAWLAGEAYTPRGRGFMGKAWDAFVPGPEYWRECLRVLKPGGHLLAFAGTRTWDVMGLALRLAGFELRDTLQWLHGQGFPKSHNISAAIDKAAGAKRAKVGPRIYAGGHVQNNSGVARDNFSGNWAHNHGSITIEETAPATDAARQWDGYGTALKPAWEPIILCRKPLSESSVAANVLRWGTGALNIGASRVETEGARPALVGLAIGYGAQGHSKAVGTTTQGRWPANLLLSHAPDCTAGGCSLWCPIRALDAQSGITTNHDPRNKDGTLNSGGVFGVGKSVRDVAVYGDTGGASRYFQTFRYQAKASRSERNRGCEALPEVRKGSNYGMDGARPHTKPDYHYEAKAQNTHPTVKPLALCTWLIGLITPPGGIVLDPFAGSGSTLCAAKAGGGRYIGIEKEPEYVAIARARVQAS